MTFKDSIALPQGADQNQQDAWEHFQRLGFPTTKNEEWKFTNVNALLETVFSQSQEHSIQEKDISNASIKGLDAHEIVVINGVLQGVSSSNAGYSISSLSEAILKQPEIVSKHYNKGSKNEAEAFTALSTAIASDGIFLHVTKGHSVVKPIHVKFFFDAQNENAVSFPRNLIVAEENSEVNIIVSYHTIGDHQSLANDVTEIVVGEYARVEHFKLQIDTNNASHIGTTQVSQAANSLFKSHVISLTGKLIRNNTNIELNGERIESHMNGLYMLKGDTHVDNHTVADHKFPNCESHELYIGVLDDKSRGVFNGKIFVRQDAQKTNAFQSNRNLLISDDAKVNTKPQLEIWADDVSCSHGCTTGQLDEEALFYLRARGIGKVKARALLLRAFAGEVIEKIKIEALRTYLEDLIVERLDQN